MTFKFFVLCAAIGLAGCASAPYSPDTGYSQAPPPTTYYTSPSYVVVVPPATPASICTDTPAGC
jgi:hypothetical protein